MISDDKLKKLRQEVDENAPKWASDPATPPQLNYIRGLIETRDIPESWLLRIKELFQEPGGLKKGKAGEIIAALKPLPVKKGQDDRAKNKPQVKDLPVGRYALRDENDDISFYRVKEWNGRMIMLRIAGPNEYVMPYNLGNEVAKRIVRAGIGNSAALYGHEIKRCSICHTRISNRVSRELGIGPICGGRVYDDWEDRVNSARQALKEQGLDPDESID